VAAFRPGRRVRAAVREGSRGGDDRGTDAAVHAGDPGRVDPRFLRLVFARASVRARLIEISGFFGTLSAMSTMSAHTSAARGGGKPTFQLAGPTGPPVTGTARGVLSSAGSGNSGEPIVVRKRSQRLRTRTISSAKRVRIRAIRLTISTVDTQYG